MNKNNVPEKYNKMPTVFQNSGKSYRNEELFCRICMQKNTIECIIKITAEMAVGIESNESGLFKKKSRTDNIAKRIFAPINNLFEWGKLMIFEK